MSPTRRRILAAGVLTGLVPSVAGCLGDDDQVTDGNDDDPFDTGAEALLLSPEQLHEPLAEGWVTEESNASLFADADAAVKYIPFDEEAGEFHQESGRVGNGAWLYDDVETARETFEELPYHEGWGYEDREIAVESIGGVTDDHADAQVLFRDANAIGGLQYENSEVGVQTREERALELAVIQHESWRD